MTIGVAVITCNRPDYLKKCIDSLPPSDKLVIVNDGERYNSDLYPNHAHVIQHEKNLGVAGAKNSALKYLMNQGVEHIFIFEDDCTVLRKDILNAYIHASKVSGIRHFNFAPSLGKNYIRYSHDYQKECSVSFYIVTGQPFAYFHRSVIEEVGYYDETFINDCEHHEFTYRISKKNFTTPLMWFADIKDSKSYLNLPERLFKDSVIGPVFRWRIFIPNQLKFLRKYGFHPWIHRCISKKKLIQLLKKIQVLYGAKF